MQVYPKWKKISSNIKNLLYVFFLLKSGLKKKWAKSKQIKNHNERLEKTLIDYELWCVFFFWAMPREVLQLHIGQCGLQICKAVWAQLNAEHNLSYEGKKLPLDNMHHVPSAFFYETDGGKYSKRKISSFYFVKLTYLYKFFEISLLFMNIISQ